MLPSGLLTSYLSCYKLQMVYPFCCEVHEGCLPYDKKDSDETVHNLQLGLEVERPERNTTFLFFTILHDKRNSFSFYAFFQAPYTEPLALFMKFPTRIIALYGLVKVLMCVLPCQPRVTVTYVLSTKLLRT